MGITTPTLLFSDGFETGDFSQWTESSGLVVQQQQVYAGTHAVRGTSNGSPTYAYRQLTQERSELYYRMWFKILSQDLNSVYLQRFRTSSTSAIMGVFVGSTGKLGYRNDVTGLSTTSSTTVTAGIWHELQAYIRIDGSAGKTDVWLDGVRIGSLSNTENLGNALIGRIQLGETSSGRIYDIAMDRVALSTNHINSYEPPEKMALPGAGVYDNADGNWSYNGSWVAFSGSAPYTNNTTNYTAGVGDTASFTFSGTQFILTYTQAPNRGDIDVYVDGNRVATINATGSLAWQKTYTSPVFPAGTHVVEFKHAGGGGAYIDVDAIQVLATLAPGVGVYDDSNTNWSYSSGWASYDGSNPYWQHATLYQSTGQYSKFRLQWDAVHPDLHPGAKPWGHRCFCGWHKDRDHQCHGVVGVAEVLHQSCFLSGDARGAVQTCGRWGSVH